MKTIILENGQRVQISDESHDALRRSVQNKRWKPKYGEKYWYVTDNLCVDWDKWEMKPIDDSRYHAHNVFLTAEQAQAKADALRKKYEMINRIEELNQGWKPDWEYMNQCKHYIIWYNEHQTPRVNWQFINQSEPDEYYFKSETIGHHLINEFGNDLKYLFEL